MNYSLEAVRIIKLFNDSGYSLDEYKEINNELSFYTYPSRNLNYTSNNNLIDVLIDLYKENLKDKKWYEDKNFIYIINSFLGVPGSNFKESKYSNTLERFIFNSYDSYEKFENKLTSSIENKPDFGVVPIPPFIIKNELYLGTKAKYYKDNKLFVGIAYFKYDFENSKLSNYEFIE